MIYRTVIIDDDEKARAKLTGMLKKISSPCELIGEASDGYQAIQIINHLKPDLIFIDIGIPGLNGIEVLKYCSNDPFVIFTTSYSGPAAGAFDKNAVSYLQKPISTEDLVNSIMKLQDLTRRKDEKNSGEEIKSYEVIQQKPAQFQFVPVKSGEIIKLLNLDWIACIRAEGKYTIVSTSEKEYVSNFSISDMEERLDSPQFIRVHRSYIINLKHVVELKRLFDRKFKVVLNIRTKEDIIVSKNYFDLLKTRIGLQ